MADPLYGSLFGRILLGRIPGSPKQSLDLGALNKSVVYGSYRIIKGIRAQKNSTVFQYNIIYIYISKA